MAGNYIYGELKDADFKRLSEFIYANYGINLYPHKKVLVKSRLQKRLAALGMQTYNQYCDFVLTSDNGKKEVVNMIDRISTNKTDFFREADHFNLLSKSLLKQYISETGRKKLKLWSAGCSSGEEAYTLAMVMNEEKKNIPFLDFKIYASDISTLVLEKAKKAVYSADNLDNIPSKYQSEYLLKNKDKSKNQIRITPNLRNKVIFFRYNLLDETSPLKQPVDIIFCRNTLIYFDRKTQEKVINMLIKNITSGGYLFLGHSESLINTDFPLKNIFPAVYKKV